MYSHLFHSAVYDRQIRSFPFTGISSILPRFPSQSQVGLSQVETLGLYVNPTR